MNWAVFFGTFVAVLSGVGVIGFTLWVAIQAEAYFDSPVAPVLVFFAAVVIAFATLAGLLTA